MMHAEHITDLIGQTPVLKIKENIHGIPGFELYAKLELFNPFGSLKDRISWSMLEDEIQEIVQKGQVIVESSSGNTAKALAALAGSYGVKFKTVSNRIKVPEVKQILQLMGAEVEELPGLSECPDPNDPNDPLAYIETMMRQDEGKYFHTSQYTNPKNPQVHFETTGPEIEKDLGQVDFLFGGVGTSGSTLGTANYLRQKNQNFRSIGIIAEKGDFIPGIRNQDELLELGIFQRSSYEELITVDVKTAIEYSLELIRKMGLLAGPTSGAALAGAIAYLKQLPAESLQGKKGVFIACDRAEWYLSYYKKRRPELFEKKTHTAGLSILTELEILAAETLTPQESKNLLEKEKVLLVDIRGNLGFSANHIAGSINIPDFQLEEMLQVGIPFSAGQKILLVCSVGEQSKKFVAFLGKKGFDAKTIEGGILAWRDEGLPLQRNLSLS